jgi:hypothetical protein
VRLVRRVLGAPSLRHKDKDVAGIYSESSHQPEEKKFEYHIKVFTFVAA